MWKSLALLLLIPSMAWANIGSVTELSGSTGALKRNSSTVDISRGTAIESNDLVIMGTGSETLIVFNDNSEARITENSRLVIDDFVYDPAKTDAAKVGMRVTLGTVRMASGQIAKNNRQRVNIGTPTAKVTVRGTDFSMTVDELGRSTIVLLPSCDDEEDLKKFEIVPNCTTGSIEVETEGGVVSLTEPFLATFVLSAAQPPLPPVQVPMDITLISNALNLDRPDTIQAQLDALEDDEGEMNDEDIAFLMNNKDRSKKSDDEDEKKKKDDQTIVEVDTNNCFPFDECGNVQGRNYYYHFDEERGNEIMISTGERFDNVTYGISVNNNDISYRVVGDGSSKITVRQWND